MDVFSITKMAKNIPEGKLTHFKCIAKLGPTKDVS